MVGNNSFKLSHSSRFKFTTHMIISLMYMYFIYTYSAERLLFQYKTKFIKKIHIEFKNREVLPGLYFCTEGFLEKNNENYATKLNYCCKFNGANPLYQPLMQANFLLVICLKHILKVFYI